MVINSPAARWLPHAAPMLLLDQLIAVDDEQVHCQVSTCAGGVLTPFLTPQGELPAWFGVEMMAQTVGVWSGWHAKQGGATLIPPGMLLGGRGWRAERSFFPASVTLDIRMTLLMRDDRMGSFEGDIHYGTQRLASGRLNTYQPNEAELQQLMSQGNQP
ncbi:MULTISPECIES: ApeP family dehydratase [Pantoea]|uniref:ApeP family dehydratase n=1 Tax=Pantoea TaxID=53335 RepID=UPI00142D9D9E|nr:MULTISPECIES: 3-hydroxy-fatty acyl-ACP dehydratase [Pantoea]KAF6638971.1 3-hydroxy-fatty acyl-ACP dehydratase [Pantoea sp. EKM10T]KAF6679976.1 3-hydroxy-fatty acyl-ACP dehydratase [Pantoea sp. EKM21T]KAF6684205.1 3-hydroxy-fatty acyl-ACP dehydratase [Pantoea sp. EKM22T]UVV71571.1 3-hydroxy-fatty acyl-ACP dehydratase [Pantoea agglomerans]